MKDKTYTLYTYIVSAVFSYLNYYVIIITVILLPTDFSLLLFDGILIL